MSRILDALKQIDSSSATKPRAAKPLTPVDLDEIARRRPLSDRSTLDPTAAAVGLIPDLGKLESAVSGGDADLGSELSVDAPQASADIDDGAALEAIADVNESDTPAVASDESAVEATQFDVPTFSTELSTVGYGGDLGQPADGAASTDSAHDSLSGEPDYLALTGEVPATAADNKSDGDTPSALRPLADGESQDSLIESLMALDVIHGVAAMDEPQATEPETPFEASPDHLVGLGDVAESLFTANEISASPAADDALDPLLGSDDTPPPVDGADEDLDPVFGTDCHVEPTVAHGDSTDPVFASENDPDLKAATDSAHSADSIDDVPPAEPENPFVVDEVLPELAALDERAVVAAERKATLFDDLPEDRLDASTVENIVDVEAKDLGSPAAEVVTKEFVLKEIAADEEARGEISASGEEIEVPAVSGPAETGPLASNSLPLPTSMLVSRFDEPVLAAHPDRPPPEAKPDAFGADQRFLDAYSALLDNLDAKLPGQLPVRLSIGSAQSRAGTHTIVAQLGHSLVERHGQDVLLIDGDLAARSLSVGMGAETNRGLLDVLSGSNSLDEVTVACGAEQLYLLPTGQGSHEETDCGREALSAMLEDVKHQFAFAIIDVGSAVHTVSSGLLQLSDAALLLVQLGATPTHLAASTVANWHRQGTRLIGSVLCDLSG